MHGTIGRSGKFPRREWTCPAARVFAALLLLPLVACAGGAKPAPYVGQFLLEYPAPLFPELPPLAAVLKVERFSAVQIYNTTAMVYRNQPYGGDNYAYRRWRVPPGDMATDFFLRDLRRSGLFRAVFGWRDLEEAPFLLQGGVEEWVEVGDREDRRAVLALQVVLLDAREKDLSRRVLLQRHCRLEEPIAEATAQGFAAAMSRAMARFSREAIPEIHAVLRRAVPAH